MIPARWFVLAQCLALCVFAATSGLQANARQWTPGLLAEANDINVNPYGDPIWQTKPVRSKPPRHVKRGRAKLHVKRADAKYRAGVKHPRSRSRLAKLKPVGKPLNILPRSIDAR